MKDLFSKQSHEYARFRPTYPESLFSYLAGLPASRDLAWDCGTGNGQAAAGLAGYFRKVIATDISEKQLSAAVLNPSVEYRIASAENSGIADKSVDLVTAAQAFHWFRQKDFFTEVSRVTKPGGVLAFWCYGLAKITSEVDALVWHLYQDILGPYWELERKLVESGYRTVKLPFIEIQPPVFVMTAQWDLAQLTGYLSTWSALMAYQNKTGHDVLAELAPKLKQVWGPSTHREVRWPLGLRVARIT